MSSLDLALFSDNRLIDGEFTTLYTEDINKIGSYPIKYRVRLQNYPGNSKESLNPFTINIIDPCSPPTSLLQPILENQEYTITDVPMPYQIPEFTVDPPWCDVFYTYSISTPEGDAAVDFDSDPTSRTFTFSNLEDIYLSGTDFQDYTITVTAESGNTATATALADFNLRLNNPCIDPLFVTLSLQPLPPQQYTLYHFNQTGFEWTHADASITTLTGNTDLCGKTVYEATF